MALNLTTRVYSRSSDSLQAALGRLPADMPEAVFIQTSGSEGVAKWVVHNDSSLQGAAAIAVEAFGLGSDDRFLETLPPFHVSGLMLSVRAQVCGADLFRREESKWDPKQVLQAIQKHGITRCSFVPAQLFDLVAASQRAPRSLVTVWIGGDRLAPGLATRAKALGWPIVETYGMTETAGMIAAGEGSTYETLPDVEVRMIEGKIAVRSPGLCLGYAIGGELKSCVGRDGFFRSEDRGEPTANGFRVLGRATQKILGEKVDLARLQEIWDSVALKFGLRSRLELRSDDRAGERVVVVVAAQVPAVALAREAYDAQVAPFEKIYTVIVDVAVGLAKLGQRG